MRALIVTAYLKGEHSDHQEVVPKENCGPSIEGNPGWWLLSKKHVYCQRWVKHGGPVPQAGPFLQYLAKR